MTNASLIVRTLAIFAMGITLIACGPGGSTQGGPPTADSNLTITVGNVPTAATELSTTLSMGGKLMEVTNTVTPSMSRPIVVGAKTDPSFSGSILVSVNAYAGGQTLASTSGSVTITAGGNAHTELTLPDTGGNQPDMARSCVYPPEFEGTRWSCEGPVCRFKPIADGCEAQCSSPSTFVVRTSYLTWSNQEHTKFVTESGTTCTRLN